MICFVILFFSCIDAIFNVSYFGRVPSLTLRVGLYATSPHRLCLLRAFRCYPSRGYARTYTPRTCVRHAKGMRQHGATHRSDSVARSTPTALRSKQERPKKIHIYMKNSCGNKWLYLNL